MFQEKNRKYVGYERTTDVQIAIPNFQLSNGLLYVTLPTEQSTGLPFHINSDFFPTSDRKSVPLAGDAGDYRSEWNRLVLQAAARLLKANLESLRLMFLKDHKTFWFIIEKLEKVYSEAKKEDAVIFGQFWESIVGELSSLPTVYSQKNRWVKPADARLPSTNKDEIISTFIALGIEVVHPDLRRYYNILTSSKVGVASVKPDDLMKAFDRFELTREPVEYSYLPQGYQSRDGLRKIWEALDFVIGNKEGFVKEVSRQYSLAPCEDGKLRRFASVFFADEETKQIFKYLLSSEIWFIEGNPAGDKLASKLCKEFSPVEALDQLSRMSQKDFESARDEKKFDPRTLLKWFADRKNDKRWFSDSEHRAELQSLAIFPSEGRLKPFGHLMLPGSFVDSLGLSELIELDKLGGLKDFLNELGAQDMTFPQYVKAYASRIFSDEASSSVRQEIKRQMVALLALHIGEIREDSAIESLLYNLPLVECDDGRFREAQRIYLRTSETQKVFNEPERFAKTSNDSENLKELYIWLGAASLPRATDVTETIRKIASSKPTPYQRGLVVNILEVIGTGFENRSITDQTQYGLLRRLAWLPAERDETSWHYPNELYGLVP